jgi:hypothetical protein
MTDKAGLLSQLARALGSGDLDQSLPLRLCRASVEILDADGGAITLAYTKPERLTLCATDSGATTLEDLQDVLGEGPGPDAYTSGEAVIAVLDGTDPAQRWLMLTEAARAALGFEVTLYALPIRPEQDVLGVLTLYQATQRPLARETSAALFLADALGAALLRDPDSQAELSPPGPWASRARIHQATGIVIAQLKVGPDDALALLRAHAFAHNATLEMIAAEVIEGRLDFNDTNKMGNG